MLQKCHANEHGMTFEGGGGGEMRTEIKVFLATGCQDGKMYFDLLEIYIKEKVSFLSPRSRDFP